MELCVTEEYDTSGFGYQTHLLMEDIPSLSELGSYYCHFGLYIVTKVNAKEWEQGDIELWHSTKQAD